MFARRRDDCQTTIFMNSDLRSSVCLGNELLLVFSLIPPTAEPIQARIKQHNSEAYEHLILPNLFPAIRLDTRHSKRVAVGGGTC